MPPRAPVVHHDEEEPAISSTPAPAAVQVSPANSPGPKNTDANSIANQPAKTPPSIPPAAVQAPNSGNDGPAAPTSTAEMEKCLEGIWEQLIAAPPSRGRSMSTVVLQDTKVLLSSWEVGAFVADGGQEAEDLRRAVVARALLGLAIDQRKRSGDLETARFRAGACANRSFLFPGTRGTSQARKKYGGCSESRYQHETASFVHRGSRKASALKLKTDGGPFESRQRPDCFGRYGICSVDSGTLAG